MFNFSLSAEDKISKTKIHVLRHSPFFSYLVEHLKFEKADIGTCAVDGKGTFYYDENFVNKVTEKQLAGVFMHEVLHVAFQHPHRGKNKNIYVGNVSLWNIATDIVVNYIVMKNSGDWAELPKGAIVPDGESIDIFGVTIEDIGNKSAEDIYFELLEKLKQKYGDPQTYTIPSGGKGSGEGEGECESGNGNNNEKNGDGNGEGDKNKDENEGDGKTVKGWKDIKAKEGFDKHRWDNSESNGDGDKDNKGGDMESEARKWKKILAEAYNYAKQRGDTPLGVEREYEEMKKGKVNWRAIIRATIKKQIPSDFTWTHPNRKYIGQGVYLPAVKREGADIIVSIDTSGSMSNKELGEVITEIISIARSIDNIDIRIITHDSEVHDDYLVRNGNIPKIKKLKMHGGGGTSHIPLFKYIEEKYPRAKLLISFTDGYSAYPDKPPKIRTVFALVGDMRIGKDSMPRWATKVIEVE